ncbi:hypothetical protein Gotur_033905 [Gossypium turneri]
MSKCVSTIEAWIILKTTHGETSSTNWNESISNEAFALGEQFFEVKLVQQILRFLPKRFPIKIIVIEEAKDINIMKLDKLIGSL